MGRTLKPDDTIEFAYLMVLFSQWENHFGFQKFAPFHHHHQNDGYFCTLYFHLFPR